MHAGSMLLVPMERWLNSDQLKKKESLKRSKILTNVAWTNVTISDCRLTFSQFSIRNEDDRLIVFTTRL